MARFRGVVRGGRGSASRLGHATTGLHLHANSWNGSIEVWLFVGKNDEDWCAVMLNPGDGKTTVLYRGPLAEYRDPRGGRIALVTTDPLTRRG